MSSPAVNVINSLNATIQVTDNTDQSQILDREINLSLPSSVAQGLIALSLTNGANILPLPKSLCYQAYIRNKDQSNAIAVTMTGPQSTGGNPPVNSAVQTWVLYPGDVLIVWQNPSSKNSNAGFSELALYAYNANILCEYFIGA